MVIGLSTNYGMHMIKTFSHIFNEHLEGYAGKITDIASATGVSKEALYSLKYGKTLNMNVNEAIKVARFFGETVEQFMGLSPKQALSNLEERMALLPETERALLENSIAFALAQHGLEPPQDAPDEPVTSPPAAHKVSENP